MTSRRSRSGNGSRAARGSNESRRAQLEALPFNFPGVPTLDELTPPGFRRTVRTRIIGNGDKEWEVAGEALMRWHGHSGAGFLPVVVPPRVSVGAVSEWRIPWGPLRPAVICRVFAVENSTTRKGFGHGALVGHPQSGWESYVVRLTDSGDVEFSVSVTWRPRAWWLRVLGPAMIPVLGTVLRRNLRALDVDMRAARASR